MPDYSDVKKAMVAVRYRNEQNFTRLAGIEACKERNLAVECYAGAGGLTTIYKDRFKQVINNDINPDSVAIHCMTAMNFIKEEVRNIEQKIDMIDFDCYGSPAFEIQEFFKDAKRHAPFVLALSDGLGMLMKRSKKVEPILQRYLLDSINMEKVWLRHGSLIDNLIAKLSDKVGLHSTQICSVQTRGKNYVLAAYAIE